MRPWLVRAGIYDRPLPMIMETYQVTGIQGDLVEMVSLLTGESKRAWVEEDHECPVKVGDLVDRDHKNRLFLGKGVKR